MPDGVAHAPETIVILYFSFEELRALKAGADVFLIEDGPSSAAVLAPSEKKERVEALLQMLVGDLSVSTLQELRGVQMAIHAIVECLRVEMEAVVVATHAADEGAVGAYFDFAHALIVSHRIDEMASEMSAMIELVTGELPTHGSARDFRFPD
jgi:hypothetical protein